MFLSTNISTTQLFMGVFWQHVKVTFRINFCTYPVFSCQTSIKPNIWRSLDCQNSLNLCLVLVFIFCMWALHQTLYFMEIQFIIKIKTNITYGFLSKTILREVILKLFNIFRMFNLSPTSVIPKTITRLLYTFHDIYLQHKCI